MRNGIVNKLASVLNIKHKLLLHSFKNRNPRAIQFQKAFSSDIYSGKSDYDQSISYFQKIGIFDKDFIVIFLDVIKGIIESQTRNNQLIKILNEKDYLSLTSGQWLELSMYLLSLGLFNESYLCRIKSHKAFPGLENKIIFNLIYRQLKICSLFGFYLTSETDELESS